MMSIYFSADKIKLLSEIQSHLSFFQKLVPRCFQLAPLEVVQGILADRPLATRADLQRKTEHKVIRDTVLVA